MSIRALRLILVLCVALVAIALHFGLQTRYYRIEEFFTTIEEFTLNSVRTTRSGALYCGLFSLIIGFVLYLSFKENRKQFAGWYVVSLITCCGFVFYAMVIASSPRHISFDEAFPIWIAFGIATAIVSWIIYRKTPQHPKPNTEVLDQEVW